ncbi:MAG TPA: efflux RND transporter permease subunit [Candidatus Baltobacteraceae bacterium]
MSLTRLFIKRPTLVFVLVALMLFAGILSTVTIVKELYPDVTQPTISINAQYNGASVTEMRDNIVQPIEQALAGTPDLQTTSAVVQQGQASITATFLIASDQATDLAQTQKAVQSAERQLPSNMQPPTIGIRDPAESVVVTFAIYSNKLSLSQLSLYAQNVIAPDVEQVPGISYANVGGIVTPAYEIEVDPTKLAAAGLTINDVINTVSNDNQRVPGGFAYESNRQTTIDVRGDIQDIKNVENLPIIPAGSTGGSTAQTAGQVNNYAAGITSLPGTVDPWTASTQVVRIGDVAKVTDSYEPRQQFAQISGRPGLFLSVQKAANASEVDSSNAVLRALPQIQKQFPGIDFKIINVQSRFTQQQINIVVRTLLEAILVVALAMVFFLRSWRNALVVCVSIPTSLAIAVTAMKMLNLTIDTISLLGMSLVIGILVDDSTVVLENIERHFRELHQSPEDAAVEGRQEIGAAAVVITLVDVVVFFPIAFIQGQVGRNLAEFAIVVVISTLTSLFVSFTVTPTLAGLWALRSHWNPPKMVETFGKKFDDLRDWYAHRALPWSLEHGKFVAIFCGATFILALAMIPLGVVGEEFVPASDRGEIYIQLTYPIGSPIATVRDQTFKFEKEAIDVDQGDIEHETTVAGAYSASFGGFVTQSNVSQIHIFLKDNRKHSTSYWVAKYQQYVKQYLPNVTAAVVPATGTGGGNAQPIDFLVSDLSGKDPTADATKVLNLLQHTPGATSVNSSGTQLAPEISIEFDREKAQALGIDIGQAATAAGAAFGGDVATQFETTAGLEQVQVIYPQEDQTNLTTLQNLPLRASDGSIVHLSDIATFVSTPTPPLVTRTDRRTVIHVDANVAGSSSLSNVQSAFFKRLPSLHLAPSVVVRPAPLGQQDFMAQTLVGIGASMILSIALVFLLMVALYNSYTSPFIIIFSVPVAAIGAVSALVMTHKTLNLFSLIGTILLIGIATKNGILLVDYANTLRERGRAKLAAIKESAFTRFRPIIMTSVSIIAGNLALALAFDPGSESRSSLGIVIIGGVVSSLILTLALIPNMYMWLAPSDEAFSRNGHSPKVRVEQESLPLEPVT